MVTAGILQLIFRGRKPREERAGVRLIFGIQTPFPKKKHDDAHFIRHCRSRNGRKTLWGQGRRSFDFKKWNLKCISSKNLKFLTNFVTFITRLDFLAQFLADNNKTSQNQNKKVQKTARPPFFTVLKKRLKNVTVVQSSLQTRDRLSFYAQSDLVF